MTGPWADPVDGSTLRPDGDVWRSDGGGVYPVFAGVPVLVPDPAAWCARYREAVLASLAEVGAADPSAVALVDAFAAAAAAVEPARFGDDWVAHEAGAPAIRGSGAGHAHLEAFVAEAHGALDGWLAAVRPPGRVLELGCGAGHRADLLDAAWVADLSLRAVLRGRRADRAGAVADAEDLPLGRGSLDGLVAVNVVDLLDRPRAFLAGAAEALTPGGRLVLTTPDPALGTGEPAALDDLLVDAGLDVVAAVDHLPWLRVHHDRHLEVYRVAGRVARSAGSTAAL